MFRGSLLRLVVSPVLHVLPLAGVSWAAHINTHAPASKSKSQQKISESQRTRRRMHHLARSRSANLTNALPSDHAAATAHYERFHMSSFAEDITRRRHHRRRRSDRAPGSD